MLVVFVQTWMELLNIITPHNYHSYTSSGKQSKTQIIFILTSSCCPKGYLLVIFLFSFPYEENDESQNSHKISSVGDQAILV